MQDYKIEIEKAKEQIKQLDIKIQVIENDIDKSLKELQEIFPDLTLDNIDEHIKLVDEKIKQVRKEYEELKKELGEDEQEINTSQLHPTIDSLI